MPDRLQGGHGGPVVVGDLARVHLVGEPDPDLVEHVEDRVPAVGEVAVAGLDDVVGHRREHGHVVPDRRAGEADHDVDPEGRGGPGRQLHLLGGPLPDALRVAVTPDPRVHHVLVAIVDDRLADRLPVQVVGDRPAAQPVLGEDVPALGDVRLVLGRPGHVEVVAPAGDLQPVVAPLGGQPAHLAERQVRPLPGEQGHRPLLPSGLRRGRSPRSRALLIVVIGLSRSRRDPQHVARRRR